MLKKSNGIIAIAALLIFGFTTFSALAESVGTTTGGPLTYPTRPKQPIKHEAPPPPEIKREIQSAPMGAPKVVPSQARHTETEWTNTIDIPNGVFHYNARTGAASIDRVDSSGNMVTKDYPAGSFKTGWTHIVNTPNGILFYCGANGAAAVGVIDDSGNHTTIKEYPEGAFALGWTSIVNTPEGILYRNSKTGAVAVGRIDSAGNHTTIR